MCSRRRRRTGRRCGSWIAPNPAGRPVEGLTLRKGWESFVGAGPMPMRHGLTLGELGAWFIARFHLDLEYRVIEMEGWQPEAAPGFGWPLGERTWVNPSPNAPNLSMARAYAGTVMLEGRDPFRRARDDAAAGTLRRARHRRPARHRRDARPRSRVAQGMPSTRLLVRADVPQAYEAALQRRPNPRRRRELRSPRVSPRGVCRRWVSRPSGVSIPIIPCGAISRTSTRSGNWRLTS